MKILNLVLGFIIFLGCAKATEENQTPTVPIITPIASISDNHVVAHRGAWKEFDLPENSLAALAKAIDIKFYASECDVQMTKDKKIVVFHDEKIDGKYFKDIEFSDLAYYKLSNGETLPLLSSFIDQVVADKKINLWIDVKSLSDSAGGNAWSSQTAEVASGIIRNKGAQKQVVFIVGRKDVLDKSINATKGEWPCAYMNGDYSPANFQIQGYNWANLHYSKFYKNDFNNNIGLINEYISKNIRLTVFTVDDENAMNWFLAKSNISAITTNYPFKLVEKIRK